MPNLMDVKVGDTLYDSGVRNDLRTVVHENTLTVTKVSRKYLTARSDEYRGYEVQINRETGQVKVDFNTYKVWQSKEQFEDWKECQRLVIEISKVFGVYGRSVPKNMTSEKLKKVLNILEGKE